MEYISSAREEKDYIKDFKIKELPFTLILDRILSIRNKYDDEIATCYLNAKFIAKDKASGDYYLAAWGSGGDSYTEKYTFIKIYFDLYLKYLKGEIQYHMFRYESLKRSGVEYKMMLLNSQFVQVDRWVKEEEEDKPRIVFEIGNEIEYTYGYAFSLETMPTYYMNIPFEVIHEPEYVKLIEQGATFIDEECDTYHRKQSMVAYDRMDENFKRFVLRECKLESLLS